MDDVLRAAEAALRRSPSPALALSDLVEEIRADLGHRAPEPIELLDALRRHPGRFKILDPGKGPWRFLAQGSHSAVDEPWIVSLGDPDSPTDTCLADQLERRLRESVRSVAVALDADSPREVLRWRALAMASAALARRFGRKAA